MTNDLSLMTLRDFTVDHATPDKQNPLAHHPELCMFGFCDPLY